MQVRVIGASVCFLQFSAWTAALWNAPLSSRLCAPWIATKPKSDSQRTAAVLCRQGWFAISFLSVLLSYVFKCSVKNSVCFSHGKPNTSLFL